MGQVTDGDLLQEAVAELYSSDPGEFIARRAEFAARARKAGEAAAAKQIAALRKPTRSAWVVNQLLRAQPDVAAQLETLGAELRSAQNALDGKAIRDLSRQRRELVDALTRQAFTVSGQRSPPAALRDEVTGTFGAALADPQVAEQLRAGALERPARRDGFGSAADPDLAWEPGSTVESDFTAESDSTVVSLPSRRRDAASRPDGARTGGARTGGAKTGGGRTGAGGTGADGTGADGTGADGTSSPARGRPVAKVTALAAARARAERERRREAVAAAQLAMAAADRDERRAARVERDQESIVRVLEEDLADARQRLAEARLQAHRARSAQRQARRALDRLEN
jgi:hypothetical protein